MEPRQRYLFTLGLHHDQQHQELFLMDLLNLMSRSPLDPAAYPVEPRVRPVEAARGGVARFEGGLATIGQGAAISPSTTKGRPTASGWSPSPWPMTW